MARFFINFDYIISTKYDKSVLNILCMTYLVTSSVAVFEAAIRVKSTHLIKSCLETRKKGNVEITHFFDINLHPEDHLDI